MHTASDDSRPNLQLVLGTASFAICFAALIGLRYEPSLFLVYLMVVTQGVMGYGLTSVMGAVVLEIFQGPHYGSIFGTLMLLALAGGAAGPWVMTAPGESNSAGGAVAVALPHRRRYAD